jgi:hypothetical protein
VTRDEFKQVAGRMWYEYRIPFAVGLAWVAIRYLFPETKTLSYLSDFFLAFFFLSWFTGNFFRVDRQQQVQHFLTDIAQATNRIETSGRLRYNKRNNKQKLIPLSDRSFKASPHFLPM